MKLTANKNKTFTLSGLTEIEMLAVLQVIGTANSRCFEERDDNGNWYSNDDFVCVLTDEQRSGLRNVCEKLDL